MGRYSLDAQDVGAVDEDCTEPGLRDSEVVVRLDTEEVIPSMSRVGRNGSKPRLCASKAMRSSRSFSEIVRGKRRTVLL